MGAAIGPIQNEGCEDPPFGIAIPPDPTLKEIGEIRARLSDSLAPQLCQHPPIEADIKKQIAEAVEAKPQASDTEKIIEGLFRDGPQILSPSDEHHTSEISRWEESYSRDGSQWIIAWEKMKKNGHLKMIAQICEEEGVPLELVFVALVESSWQSKAESHAGAKGYWQFTEGTARACGLTIDSDRGIDERTNASRSTKAAIRYLRRLYLKPMNGTA